MSSIRSKLKLDEQSFEELLAAAFTVQQHKATLKRASGTPAVCRQCGASLREGERLCSRCAGAGEEFRPGERMQRKWASLWQMGQQQGWWPEHPAAAGDERRAKGDPAGETADLEEPSLEPAGDAAPLTDLEATEGDWLPGPTLVASEEAPLELPAPEDSPPTGTDFKPESSRFTDLRLTLRFHRADLYLGLAIMVSVLAMLWVLFSASPADIRRGIDGVGPHARVHLSPWERALVKLGIAEAPDPPPPVSRGNPNAQVWVDPHTAQYYCAGEDQYGKTADGRSTSQREAQMDQFAPAGRAPCD
ncbi:MAG: hypothetical protein ACHP7J_01475 [Terriglobales bacterium]